MTREKFEKMATGNYKLLTGFCIICGRKIKIVAKKEHDKFQNILFCPKCEGCRVKRDGKRG